jgi:hypothetical protein
MIRDGSYSMFHGDEREVLCLDISGVWLNDVVKLYPDVNISSGLHTLLPNRLLKMLREEGRKEISDCLALSTSIV